MADLTSTRHSSEDPALAIFDGLASKLLPPLENIHAPDPGHRARPIFVMVVPPPRQHPQVLIITIYLWHDKRGCDGWGRSRLVREGKCLPPAHTCRHHLANLELCKSSPGCRRCGARASVCIPAWSYTATASASIPSCWGGAGWESGDVLTGDGFEKHVLPPGSLGVIITCSSQQGAKAAPGVVCAHLCCLSSLRKLLHVYVI